MRDLNRKLGTHRLEVRLWTLRDKDSKFRSKEPDRHRVEIVASTPPLRVILRGWWFEAHQQKEARAQYDQLVQLLS